MVSWYRFTRTSERTRANSSACSKGLVTKSSAPASMARSFCSWPLAVTITTGRKEVASFARQGVQADNLAIWDPGAVPAGLYLAHVRFRGAKNDHVETVSIGVLR